MADGFWWENRPETRKALAKETASLAAEIGKLTPGASRDTCVFAAATLLGSAIISGSTYEVEVSQ